jgi:hypothetical protein
MIEIKVTPGIHLQVQEDIDRKVFENEEIGIIRYFGREWYITKSGSFSIGIKSNYKFMLIKPTAIYQEMFNLEREIIVIFSAYNDFQPRTLDAFDEVIKRFQTLRLDKICYVLLSKDDSIEEKLQSVLKQNQESQVIVPFTYTEVIQNQDPYFLRNKFRKHFYTRDLFAFESPLRKDIYFFGGMI